jgi:hypothetical protein
MQHRWTWCWTIAALVACEGQSDSVKRREPPVAARSAQPAQAPKLPPPVPLGPADAAPSGGCPGEMVRVAGEYCEEPEHTCSRWLDDPKLPYARCGEYQPPAKCVGKKRRLSFCIDRYEYSAADEPLPAHHQSFVSASKACKRAGKRLCTESEWNFACEGPEARPYPYGWARAPKCNQDRTDLYEQNPRKQVLRDLRAPRETYPDCKSPFGVVNMVGNVDELVIKETPGSAYPFRNALKGGWWMAGRNRCRPSTTAHDDHYHDMQTGFRCCMDAP